MDTTRLGRALGALCGLGILSQAVFAVDLTYELGYEVEHDSNIPFNANKDSDILHSPYLSLGLSQTGSLVEAEVSVEADYTHYQGDSFDDDLRANATADVLLKFSPNRFHWVVTNDLVQTPIDVQGARNPNNQQDSNVFSTGPDFILRFGEADSLRLGARFSMTDFRESDLDSDRVTGSLAWTRSFSERSSFGLGVQSAAIDFDDPLNEDFDQHDLYGEYVYTSQLARQAQSTVTVRAGASRLDFDERGGDTNPLVRVEWALSRPEGRGYSLAISNTTSNASSALGGVTQAQNPVLSLPVTAVADPFERTALEATFTQPFGEAVWNLSAQFGTEDYNEVDRDQDFLNLNATLSYPLTVLQSLNLTVGYERQEFANLDQDDDYFTAGLGWSYQRSENWRFGFNVLWRDRQSDIALLDADSLAGIFSIVYSR